MYGHRRRGLIVLALLSAAASSQTLDASVADAGWLAGCWAGGDGDTRSEEHWMAPGGGTMIGMNRTVKDGTTVAYELIRIVETDTGSLAFIASPSGQSTTRFELVRMDESQLVFENLAHDFPQRITYTRSSANVIVARIEDESGERTIDFPMRRKDCDSG